MILFKCFNLSSPGQTIEVIDNQHAGRKSDSQMGCPTGIPNCKTHSKKDHRSDNVDANQSNINISDYFRCSAKIEADKETSKAIMQRIHNEFSDIFTGIGCFEGIFKLRVKEGSCPYQALPRRVAHTLQWPLEEELDPLQKQQITVPLDVDETSEWCNRFLLVQKPMAK